jgi:hypothetical protein
MSSSRSIAAARNRRSGDTSQQQQQQQQISRPGTSIASQAALQGGGNNRRVQSQQTQQPLQQQQQQTLPTQPSRVKLSVSDAIGLITLRLGRVEQILIDQEGAALNGGSLSIPDGTQLVDKSVFNSIINRLEAAETKGKTITTYEETIQRLEKELKDLREAQFKHEAAVKKSFEDVDAAFVDLENQVHVEEPAQLELEETTVNVVDIQEVMVDLKSLVQQDLLV